MSSWLAVEDEDGSELRLPRFLGQLTGWEDVVFELEDVAEEEPWPSD